MTILTLQEVTHLLSQDPQALSNDSFRHRFENAASFESITFETFDSFASVIWHFSPFSRVLTPPHWWGGGKLYTVGDVAKKMIEKGWTFNDFVQGAVPGKYQPSWFESCAVVYDQFNWEKCLPPVVMPVVWAERWDCPGSTFRLIDGIHRSLVIVYKVLSNELSYRPINGIVLYEKKR